MPNEPKYQGVAIINDEDEGHCITFYGAHEKRDYDLDLKDGKQPDGRRILKAQWLENPTDFDGIDKAATQLFQESFQK